MLGEVHRPRASSCLTQLTGNTVQNLTMWLWRASKTPADALAATLSETGMGSSLVSIETLSILQDVASSHQASEIQCRNSSLTVRCATYSLVHRQCTGAVFARLLPANVSRCWLVWCQQCNVHSHRPKQTLLHEQLNILGTAAEVTVIKFNHDVAKRKRNRHLLKTLYWEYPMPLELRHKVHSIVSQIDTCTTVDH